MVKQVSMLPFNISSGKAVGLLGTIRYDLGGAEFCHHLRRLQNLLM